MRAAGKGRSARAISRQVLAYQLTRPPGKLKLNQYPTVLAVLMGQAIGEGPKAVWDVLVYVPRT